MDIPCNRTRTHVPPQPVALETSIAHGFEISLSRNDVESDIAIPYGLNSSYLVGHTFGNEE